ncbi:MAG: RNA pseudouridine synthase [Opitutus sp.]|nr:RNA pseudouridine synthase [Opitutus sp.]
MPLGAGVALLHRDGNGLAAFNKPAGVLSHPNSRADEPRALLTCRYDEEAQCFVWSDGGAERRLWLLNRLDGATSGVILTAGDGELARAVREQFARKKVRKVYTALVFGKPAERLQLWRDLLAVQRKGGQVRSNATAGNIPSVTQFQFLRHGQGAFSTSLVRLEPHTGRSHQLRVQCAKRHLPIVGDQTYGDFALNRAFAKTTGEKRLFLHSLETGFSYEFGGKTHAFKAAAPLPGEFRRKY